MATDVTVAREAFKRFAWDEALTALTEAESHGELEPADLMLLAQAAWWSGRIDDSLDALERAHGGYLNNGEPSMAALVALQLSELAMKRRSAAAARGWLGRAERLLENEQPSIAHAWLAFFRATTAFMQNDLDTAMEYGEQALELAQRQGSREVACLALNGKGQMLLRRGQWAEGLALIEEATSAAVAGELEPKTACDIYCMTISACRDLADYQRAGEWVDEADRWMKRRALSGYQGVCRVHRAELKRLRGAWVEAEREAKLASDELEQFRLLSEAGYAHYEVGLVRLQMGDLAGAEEEFMRAHTLGRDPQPGLALLSLARGEVEEARSSLDRSLSAVTTGHGGQLSVEDKLRRSQRLPALVEVALAAGDVETARGAVAELESVAEAFQSKILTATAVSCRGAVELAEGNVSEAASTLDRAWRLLQDAELPYESGRARYQLGLALRASGEEAAGRMEVRAAKETFEGLGARNDVRIANELLQEHEPATVQSRPRVTKTFMFTDIVTSTDLVGVIGDSAWDELISWHNRALRSTLATHHGEEVRHTGDGFFASFERAEHALACAVDIQRRLLEHRHEHGFAPRIRIGMHTTEATRQGGDYAGYGVHVAARIAALAKGEEVLASRAALDAAGSSPYTTSKIRKETLKGVDGEVEVGSIDWR